MIYNDMDFDDEGSFEVVIPPPDWFTDTTLMEFMARVLGLSCHLLVQRCLFYQLKDHLVEDKNRSRYAANMLKVNEVISILDDLESGLLLFVESTQELEYELELHPDIQTAWAIRKETDAWRNRFMSALRG